MATKNEHAEKLFALAQETVNNGAGFAEAEKQLKLETNDQNLINEIIQQVKKEYNYKRTKNGFSKLGTGVLFLISGAFIPLLGLSFNHSFEEVLYIFTIIGAVFLLWGLYDLTG